MSHRPHLLCISNQTQPVIISSSPHSISAPLWASATLGLSFCTSGCLRISLVLVLFFPLVAHNYFVFCFILLKKKKKKKNTVGMLKSLVCHWYTRTLKAEKNWKTYILKMETFHNCNQYFFFLTLKANQQQKHWSESPVIYWTVMVGHRLSSQFGKVSGLYVALADAIRPTLRLIKSKKHQQPPAALSRRRSSLLHILLNLSRTYKCRPGSCLLPLFSSCNSSHRWAHTALLVTIPVALMDPNTPTRVVNELHTEDRTKNENCGLCSLKEMTVMWTSENSVWFRPCKSQGHLLCNLEIYTWLVRSIAHFVVCWEIKEMREILVNLTNILMSRGAVQRRRLGEKWEPLIVI